MNNPFFILGNPRSGTSLFRIMLDSHPNIVVPPECGFIEWLFEKYKDWKLTEGFEPFLNDLFETRKFETWKFDKDFLRIELNKSLPNTYQNLCGEVYMAYGKYMNSDPIKWGDKNNYFIHKLKKLDEIFPYAKYIHIIRDGRDVAVSYRQVNSAAIKSKYKPTLPNTIKEIALEWKRNVNIIQEFLSNKEDNSLIIKYENLLNNPSKTLNNVTEFLNIRYDDKMLKYYQRNKKLVIEPELTIEWKKKTLEKPDTTRISRYKNEMAPYEIEKFEELTDPILKKYGYK